MAEVEARSSGGEVERPRQGPGRKFQLTPAVKEVILTAVRGGMPYGRAGVMAGLSEATVLQWVQRAEGRHPTRPPTPELVEFVEELKRADAENEARLLGIIDAAAQGGSIIYEKVVTKPDGTVTRDVQYANRQWQAAAWSLERRKPDTYAKRERVDTRVLMHEAAKWVAEERGLKVEDVLAEAQRLVNESGG